MFIARILQNRPIKQIVSVGSPWKDFIPVQFEGTVQDAVEADGYIGVESYVGSGTIPWQDFIPVVVTGTKRWSFDANGYIPIQVLP